MIRPRHTVVETVRVTTERKESVTNTLVQFMENGKDGSPGLNVLRPVVEDLSHALGNVTIQVVYMVVMTVKEKEMREETAVLTLALFMENGKDGSPGLNVLRPVEEDLTL